MWALLLIVYGAPPNAVDWDGPWRPYLAKTLEERFFATEAECRNTAIELTAQLHHGMLAPIRYHCVAIPAELPKGAPR